MQTGHRRRTSAGRCRRRFFAAFGLLWMASRATMLVMAALRPMLLAILVSCTVFSAIASGGTDADALAGWVAYQREWVDEQASQGYSWISVARTDGRSQRNVTPRPRRGELRADLLPAWSVNGRLAFVRSLLRSTDLLVAEPGTLEVHRVNRAGASDSWSLDAPVWSPDELYIAWPAPELFVVDVRRRTRLKVAAESCAPRWSPDGQMLLFLVGTCDAESPLHRRVEVVGVKGGARRVIARGFFNSADWSPDGLRVAYAGDCDSGPGGDPFCRVLVSGADGSRLRRLRLPPGWVVDWVRWIDASAVIAGGSGQGIGGPGKGSGLLKFDVDAGTVNVLAPGVVGVWPGVLAVSADEAIAVVQRFGRRAGRPALVQVDTGAVRWGRTPPGWGETSALDLD